MRETTREFSNPEELLAAIRLQVQASGPRPTLELENAFRTRKMVLGDLEDLARSTGRELEEYAVALVDQRFEGLALAAYLHDSATPSEFVMGVEALGSWLDTTLQAPRDSQVIGRIDSKATATGLVLAGSRLLDAHPESAAAIIDGVVPMFSAATDHRARKRLASALHLVAAQYAGNDGMQKLGNPAHPRAAMVLFSEATDAGFLPKDFWYRYGVRSSHGQLQFPVAEGIYDQVVVRGNDIRPSGVDSRMHWDQIPNYCVEIFNSLIGDPRRHSGNLQLIMTHLEAMRSRGSKTLPLSSLLNLSNGVTAQVNAAGGFGKDYDEVSPGIREPLEEGDAHNLGEGMRRLLYITRLTGCDEEYAAWQAYQDDIYCGSIEGLVSGLALRGRTKKVGGAAVQQVAATQASHDAAREQAVRARTFDWRRNRPGYGYLA